MDGKQLRKVIPGNDAPKVPPGNPACPVNGRDVFQALSPHHVIVGNYLEIVDDHLTARV